MPNFIGPPITLTPETAVQEAAAAPGSATVTPQNSGTNFSSDARGPNLTTEYSAEVTYIRIDGRHVYPVAGTDTTGAQPGMVIQEHCPIEKCMIVWTAERIGKAPRAPSPNLADKNFVLTSRQVGIPAPVPTGNGKSRPWCMSGVYHYDMIVPGGTVRDFPGLGNSLDATPRTSNTVPANSFDQSLVF